MPRFVILNHDHPEPHWDFMLENGPVLKTWRLASLPASGELVVATALPDHRLHYLDYEGPVSGNRGTVSRCDRGEYRLKSFAMIGGQLVVKESLDAPQVSVDLLGEKFQGTAMLRRVREEVWEFHWCSAE